MSTPSTPATATPLASVDQLRTRLRQAKGRQPSAAALAQVQELIGPRPPEGYRRDLLIEYLHCLNDHFGVLHERHLIALARQMNLPMAEVYEVASFYHHFEIAKGDDACAPRLVLRVCQSLSCSLAGVDSLLAQLPERLRAAGYGDVQCQAVPCVGRCAQAPVAVLHQHPLPHADWAGILEALVAMPNRALAQHPVLPLPAHDGYPLLSALADGALAADIVLDRLDASGLRGLGGAGFPVGRKWRIVREQPAPRYLVVNIDEGEPGTFKDRSYLEQDPHRFLEGMLLAAHIVGVAAIYIYLRDEYHGCRALLQTALAQLQASPPCPLPPIELRRGAGAYICGEESALIASIEGQRGQPRMRPPYIAQAGLWGRPTLAHNLETLYWVRDIVERGPAWFTSFGRQGRQGLRSFSVSGRVREPGVKLAPAGISVRALIDEYCGGMAEGHQLYAYLPGGASGGILPAHLADLPLDFDTLQAHGCFIGSAAVIVLSQQDRARDAALNVMRFLADESCGQCTPCRVGTTQAAQLMQAPLWDVETLSDLASVMADASICGLGQAAPNPIRCVLQHFPHEVGLPAAPSPAALAQPVQP